LIVERTAEQIRLLHHDAHLPPYRAEVQFGEVGPVVQQSTRFRRVETDEQAGKRRLACTGPANDSHVLARLNVDRHIPKRERTSLSVAETDVLQSDLAASLSACRACDPSCSRGVSSTSSSRST
jgi:hypothetical protein